MSTSKHTPGPWSAYYNNEGLTITNTSNVTIAYVDYDECEERPVEANAHLIAAAPAMYEALKELVAYLQNHVADEALDNWALVLKAAYALAQANGE